jgi:hypothetical protein
MCLFIVGMKRRFLETLVRFFDMPMKTIEDLISEHLTIHASGGFLLGLLTLPDVVNECDSNGDYSSMDVVIQKLIKFSQKITNIRSLRSYIISCEMIFYNNIWET